MKLNNGLLSVWGVKTLNVILAASTGTMLLLFPSATSAFLGNSHPEIGMAVGLASLIYALHVLSTLARGRAARWELQTFIAGDIGWVATTAYAVTDDAFISTASGQVVALLVAACVAIFGFIYSQELRKPKRVGQP